MKKKSIVLVALILIFTMSAGGSLAWLVSHGGAVTNSFTHAYVATEIDETLNMTSKTKVRVKNTGDIDAYIRATYVVNWVNAEGQINASAPVAGKDYTVTLNKEDWEQGADGYWYCKTRVGAGDYTPELIKSISPADTTPPAGCTFQVTILADGIQADGRTLSGTKAAVDVWHYDGFID